MLKRFISVLLIASTMFLFFVGCGKNKPKQEQEKPVDYRYMITDTWYMSGMYYKNKLIDINDVSALKSMYETDMLTFNEDSTFVYLKKANKRGDYSFLRLNDEGNFEFLLSTTSNFSFTLENGSLSEKPYDGEKTQYLVTLLTSDINTIVLEEYDSLLGTVRTDSTPIIFVRSGCDSIYLDENKVDLS